MGDSYLETAVVIFFSILSIIVLIALIEAKETRRSLRLIGIFAIVTMLAFTALDYFLDISQSFWLIPWLVLGTVILLSFIIERRSTTYRLRDARYSHPNFESLQDLEVANGWKVLGSEDMLLLLSPSPFGYKTEGNLIRVADDGRALWWAELNDTGRDKYVDVRPEPDRIVATTWLGFRCELDYRTGRILSCTHTNAPRIQ